MFGLGIVGYVNIITLSSDHVLKILYLYHIFCVTLKTHCVKSGRIRNFYDPYFLVLGLNTEIYFVTFHIQSEYHKIQSRKTPNKDIFYKVKVF